MTTFVRRQPRFQAIQWTHALHDQLAEGATIGLLPLWFLQAVDDKRIAFASEPDVSDFILTLTHQDQAITPYTVPFDHWVVMDEAGTLYVYETRAFADTFELAFAPNIV